MATFGTKNVHRCACVRSLSIPQCTVQLKNATKNLHFKKCKINWDAYGNNGHGTKKKPFEIVQPPTNPYVIALFRIFLLLVHSVDLPIEKKGTYLMKLLQCDSHSAIVMKLFWFPSQPLKIKAWHWPLVSSK